MRNIKLTLAYDGTGYAGWQSQTNGRAIQDILAEAIAKMTEEKVNLLGASRTDAGVHALGQVATFQTNKKIPCDGFLRGINSLLPNAIRVRHAEEVPLRFHPIRDVKRKTYEYLLELADIPNPLLRHRVWTVPPPLRREAMEEGSRYFIGEHDFKSFQGAKAEAKTTVRMIETIRFQQDGTFLKIIFVGNGFLKQMIRNIVGTLIDVGRGKMEPQQVKKILEGKDRTKAGPSAPPRGLVLVHIEYF